MAERQAKLSAVARLLNEPHGRPCNTKPQLGKFEACVATVCLTHSSKLPILIGFYDRSWETGNFWFLKTEAILRMPRPKLPRISDTKYILHCRQTNPDYRGFDRLENR